MHRRVERYPVYVVEDDVPVLKSLCALLDAHGHQTIACETAERFLEIREPHRKACLLLDLRLPGMGGLQLLHHLNEIDAGIPIIIVTAHGDVPVAVQAMKAGAIDFIEKPARTDRLLEAVDMAQEILSNRSPPGVPKNIVADRLSKLTDREREVLQHLIIGKLNKEIAKELGISQRTVEIHRSRIREKMQARGISDLIRMMQ